MKKSRSHAFFCLYVASSMLFSVSVSQVEAVRAGSGRSSGTSRWSRSPSSSRPMGGQRPSSPYYSPNNGAAATPYPPQQPQPYYRQAAPQPAPIPAAPIAQPRRSWLGPLAGVAAGLGLAHLMSSSNPSYANGNNSNLGGASSNYNGAPMHQNGGFPWFWTLVLIAGGWWLWKRRSSAQNSAQSATSNAQAWSSPSASSSFSDVKHTISYEHDLPPAQPQQRELASDSILSDKNAFLEAAKQYFTSLQVAFDKGDLAPFQDWMLPELFTDLHGQIQERGASPNHTDVLALNAEVIDQKAEADANWVTVRFSGTTRELPDPNPKSFNEAWHFKQFHHTPNDPWKLAGIEPIEG